MPDWISWTKFLLRPTTDDWSTLPHDIIRCRNKAVIKHQSRCISELDFVLLDAQNLLRTTELELLDRERRATERPIRRAKFPVVKTMDKPDTLAIPSLNKTLVLDCAMRSLLAARTCC